jgi:hypothetical protein
MYFKFRFIFHAQSYDETKILFIYSKKQKCSLVCAWANEEIIYKYKLLNKIHENYKEITQMLPRKLCKSY